MNQQGNNYPGQIKTHIKNIKEKINEFEQFFSKKKFNISGVISDFYVRFILK